MYVIFVLRFDLETDATVLPPALPFVSVSVNRGTLGKQQITYISKW